MNNKANVTDTVVRQEQRGRAIKGPSISKMAQIPVLDHNQISEKPRWWRKKSIVKRLIARGLAFWVIKDQLARMVSTEEIRARYLAAQTLSTPWEPIELPGLVFQDPLIRHNPDGSIVRRQKPRMEWEPEPVMA